MQEHDEGAIARASLEDRERDLVDFDARRADPRQPKGRIDNDVRTRRCLHAASVADHLVDAGPDDARSRTAATATPGRPGLAACEALIDPLPAPVAQQRYLERYRVLAGAVGLIPAADARSME
jgi:hypothetical protein